MGLKITLWVTTPWLGMLSPLKRVMVEYKTMIAKMAEDRNYNDAIAKARKVACKNFAILRDVLVPMAMALFLRLLETLHHLVSSHNLETYLCVITLSL